MAAPPMILADASEDDFGAAVGELDGAVDFDRAAFEPANITHIFQVVREDDHEKRAGDMVFAKIEK